MPKPSSKRAERPTEELSYEEALAELEEIVAALEGEQNQLEEAIKLFERGQALALRCGVLLEAAELKVKQVVGDVILPFVVLRRLDLVLEPKKDDVIKQLEQFKASLDEEPLTSILRPGGQGNQFLEPLVV